MFPVSTLKVFMSGGDTVRLYLLKLGRKVRYEFPILLGQITERRRWCIFDRDYE